MILEKWSYRYAGPGVVYDQKNVIANGGTGLEKGQQPLWSEAISAMSLEIDRPADPCRMEKRMSLRTEEQGLKKSS
ncbi:hypothetical protein JXO59_13125, partial [candidate division KSB1 bacterium]|nr:hypothetical protein [candidate division KSB1 bacterium]